MHRQVVAEQDRQEAGRQQPQQQRRGDRGQHRDRPEAPPGQAAADRRRRGARQQVRQRPGQRQQPAEQQADRAAARIQHALAAAAEGGVQPGAGLDQALPGIEDADMLDALHHAPGGGRCRRRNRHRWSRAPAGRATASATMRRAASCRKAGSQAPTATSRLRGWPAVTSGPKPEKATVAAHLRPGEGPADDDVGRHGMAEQRDPPVAQRPRRLHHPAQRRQQHAGRGRVVASGRPRAAPGSAPWPGKSKVTAMKPAWARVVAKGCIICCEPAKPCAMTTTGARRRRAGRPRRR